MTPLCHLSGPWTKSNTLGCSSKLGETVFSILQQIRGQERNLTDREDSKGMQPVVLRLSVTLRELDSAAPQLASDLDGAFLRHALDRLALLPFGFRK